MTSERSGEMFKGDEEKFPLVSMGGRADPSSVRTQGARTPIGASGNSHHKKPINVANLCKYNKPSIRPTKNGK